MQLFLIQMQQKEDVGIQMPNMQKITNLIAAKEDGKNLEVSNI